MVKSFTRTLVAVSDLADQFGGVYFNSKGVYIITRKESGKRVTTCVGRRNMSRLYNFDIGALHDHSESLAR